MTDGTGSLRLARPLVVLDTETTGAEIATDRVVQIALVKLHPDGRREEWERLVNPEMPIPLEAQAIHGIKDEDVQFAPPFRRVAPEILVFCEGCDLAGFNLTRFDLPLLRGEFQRAGMSWNLEGVRVVDAQRIFHSQEPRDLTAALRFYCGRAHEGAHGAMADTRATLDVILAQLDRYPDLPRDVEGLDARFNVPDARFVDTTRRFRWLNGEPVFNFGQKRGRTLREVAERERSYLEWMLSQDFGPEVRRIVADALEGRIPRRAEDASV
jgi:DNA polymerase-3 subunit epsilon